MEGVFRRCFGECSPGIVLLRDAEGLMMSVDGLATDCAGRGWGRQGAT